MESKTTSGLRNKHPSSLRCCSKVACFTGIYSLTALTTSTLSVYISSQITTLEKQFGFTSSQSGFLQSCNEIGFLLLTLIVSYKATTINIPRVLGISTILYGFAGIWCAFAYFIKPTATPSNDKTNTSTLNESVDFLIACNTNAGNSSKDTQFCNEESRSVIGVATTFTPWAMVILATGMIFQGVGKAPRLPYATYYIDENTEKRTTSMHFGAVFAVGMFGPALAFILGAVFSNIYVSLEDTTLSTKDPRWIGAWWLGFLGFGVISIFLALPLFCFPKRFDRNNESDINPKMRLTLYQHTKDFICVIFRLLRNGCFAFSTLGTCSYLFYIAGNVSFTAKYLEIQFTVPAWHANILLGSMNFFCGSIGSLIGAFVVYKFRMTPYECIRLTLIVMAVISTGTVFGFFVGCDNPVIMGHNGQRNTNLSACINDCNCDPNRYFPVCGSDQMTYFSNCFAGCTNHDSQGFGNCICIGNNATAVPGLCPTECNMLYVYITLVFVVALTGNLSFIPGYMFALRSVDDKDKAMAVGVRSILQTLLAWFPGPVVYGKIIDTCCRLWNQNCGKSGSCSLYDLNDFRYKKHGLDLGVTSVAVMMYIITFLLAKRRPLLKEHCEHKTNCDSTSDDVHLKALSGKKTNAMIESENENETHAFLYKA